MKKLFLLLFLIAGTMGLESQAQTCWAQFQYSGQSNTIAFVDSSGSSTGTVVSWLWQFGDGNSSSLQNPTHTYTQNGIYGVCLTITTNDSCSQTLCDTVVIGCDALFGYSQQGSTVSFTDYSSGNIDTWYWNFDDGNSSTQQHPTHTYAIPGTYNVCLTAYNSVDTTCSGYYCATVVISGGGGSCTADFTYTTNNLTATFIDNSTNASSYNWYFGDGGTSTQMNPSHTYAQAGTYNVTLVISDSACTDSVTKAVTVTSQGGNCVSSFTYTIDTTGLTAFTEQTTGNVNAYAWDFGDGNSSTAANPVHLYTASGTYVVCLTAYSTVDSSCYDVSCQTLTVNLGGGGGNCSANFFAYDSLSTVYFVDNSTGNPTNWSWNFGDGNTSTAQHPVHTYANAGTYTVCLTIWNQTCSDTICQTVVVTGGGGGNCVADFGHAIDSSGTGTVWFWDNSTGNPTSWAWDFGDGSSGTGAYPTHTYLQPGNYTVCLTISNGTCSDTICKVVSVTQAGCGIALTFTTTPARCDSSNGTATVNATGGTPPYTYYWYDGQTTQTASNLNWGYHYVTVTDAQQCAQTNWVYVAKDDSGCYAFITGQVYLDLNGNCVFDSTDLPNPYAVIYASPWGYTVADMHGNYTLTVLPGTYDVHVQTGNNITVACPSNPDYHTVTVNNPGDISSGNDFYLEPLSNLQDLRIGIYTTTPAPGFMQWNDIYYYNDGGVPMSGYVELVHDANVTLDWSYPIPDSYDPVTYTATWNFTNLLPGQYGWIWNNVSVDTSQVIGSVLGGTCTIYPVIGDATPYNNDTTFEDTVRGSWDPNDMLVSPKGDGPQGFISNDQVLTYTVRFQNTGTWVAHNVIVRDTLDDDLDINTLNITAARHNFTVDIEDDHILVFTFENIMLPDSNTNEPESHGSLTYTIAPKINLMPGTEIHNSASIYFDFNPGIKTNTVLNTIEFKTNVETTGMAAANQVNIYPNPTMEDAILDLTLTEDASVYVSVTNHVGQEVFVQISELQAGQYNLPIAMDELPAGIYMANVKIGENASFTHKLVKLD